MNKLTRLLTLLVVAFGGLGAAKVASADVSYNVGYVTEYYYRGILQKSSSASAGIDFEQEGFYVGAWGADVGDGMEIDGYLGYGWESEEGFSASIGFTGYYYTGNFDDTYEEFNLNLGYKIFGLEYSAGEWDGSGGQDYDFLAASLAFENGISITYGTFGDEFDGDYVELAYGTTITEADIDIGVSIILSSDELSDQCDPACGSRGNDADGNALPDIATESEAIVFSIGKSF